MFVKIVNGNRLAPYYVRPKDTGELWVYVVIPLPNPSGNTDVMVYVCVFMKIDRWKFVTLSRLNGGMKLI